MNSTVTLLVIDDDPDVRHATTRILKDAGYTVLSGASATEAITMTRQHHPALVLLDVVMTDGSGVEAAKTIKTDPALVDVAVILVSGSRVTPDNQAEGLDNGLADGYITRPFHKHEFLARVESCIRLRAIQLALREKSAELEKTKKAESLGRMAGAVAHHLNNQLMAVMGNMELAMDELSPDSEPSKMLHEAMKSANCAARLSKEMLTYLGYTAGERKKVDFSGICRTGVSLIESSKPDNVTLVTDITTPGPVITAFEEQIHQALVNLTTNAWEAIKNKYGTVHITVTSVPFQDIPEAYRFPTEWQPKEGTYICLEVKDNGSGIASEDIEKIFDPFFTTKFLGRGMGLPIVLGIARAHRGGIVVTSEPGQWSSFKLFLPISE